ncbi:MAG: cysteine hydrolase [Acidimicrobiia bacterium]|nr:cysteine hydrolase [Acidimicrobiia bacterium]
MGAIPGAVTVTAAGVDGFYGGPLAALLRRSGVDQIVLAGFGLETTIHSTMRSANDAGLECLAVVDACVALDPELTPRTVSMIEMSGGIFGAVGVTGPVLDALTASCRCPAA